MYMCVIIHMGILGSLNNTISIDFFCTLRSGGFDSKNMNSNFDKKFQFDVKEKSKYLMAYFLLKKNSNRKKNSIRALGPPHAKSVKGPNWQA